MIRSMTGYGSGEAVSKEYKVTAEIKSVNHRFCDISVRLPRKLSFYENDIRTHVKKFASRGKIDVFISYEEYEKIHSGVIYQKDMAASYIQKLEELSEDFSLENTLSTYEVACLPEVFKIEDRKPDEDNIKALFKKAIEEAGQRLVQNREAEGLRLKDDLMIKLDGLLVFLAEIESRAPEILEAYREKLMTKVSELLDDRNIDDSILVSELVVFADKICVDEETVRLRSHIENMKNTLEQEESVGRKLDFIAQEMNREANTILSKANDLEVSNQAISLKTEIEKIREQIQNIE